ncbi:MAG: 50S ribosomal protein L28 [Candidatus Omnitrophica bacterium]|nr:50S ribosomal protein L28 [Candidatus Omnitrophota bacterium]
MAKVCFVCGKKTVAGKTIARRGLAKKYGGVGQRITGISKRRFLPNLQTVKTVVNGKNKRVRVCTKCLKAGKIVKAA